MPQYYIGLISGTSADGIDAALVDFSEKHPKLIDALTYPLPADLQQSLIDFSNPKTNEIDQMAELDIRVGKIFAKATHALLKKTKLNASDIVAIGSHGQNIRHRPNNTPPFSLQIGDPNTLAALTGITTVADFRRKDLALGGQGAPLAPALHQYLFQSDKHNRVVVNIGGIANISVLQKDISKPIVGFDTGPGNCLMDTWCLKQLNKAYDDNGNFAKSGSVLGTLLETLLQDPYFNQPPPKSTGREYFHEAWLTQFLSGHESPADVQATLCELTALSIANAIKHFINNGEVLVCGGGVHNTFLMSRLEKHCQPLTVNSTQSHNICPDSLEAMLFAWLAMRTLSHQTGNLPSVTGAKQATILGGIYFA